MQYDVVVIGSGESGTGTALLAKSLNKSVFVTDFGQIPDKYKLELKSAGIAYEEGGHSNEIILAATQIVKSPGVPEKAPIIKAIRAQNREIIGEIEFAYLYMPRPARVIAITGSNGKTTTTTLVAHILESAGLDVQMGGNVGRSYARLVMQVRARVATGMQNPIYVLELSSFQLDDIHTFRPDLAVVLNITPDHLDRYDYTLDNYVQSKFRIGMNQTKIDTLLLNAEDPVSKQYIEENRIKTGAHIQFLGISDDDLPRFKYKNESFLTLSGTKLIGPHNAYNAKVAAKACDYAGMTTEMIQNGLNTYQPPPHRMELVPTNDQITWINDSKATNVDSVFFALQSVTAPIIWIVGGIDKGNDYTPLLNLVSQKVKTIVYMGLDNTVLEKVFGNIPLKQIVGSPSANTHSTTSLISAVHVARAQAQPGDTVLLSPACASFDLFKNYEDRGDQFRAAVINAPKA
jgi:UDP-N-acetylmuramoylalanine--D-glutamate ligase